MDDKNFEKKYQQSQIILVILKNICPIPDGMRKGRVSIYP